MGKQWKQWQTVSLDSKITADGDCSHKIKRGLLLEIKTMTSLVKVTQSCLTLCYSMDYTVHGILQARILEWVALPFSRGSSHPRNWTQVSQIAGDSLPVEPQGKPKNTGMGSLSLLQQIFPTQESNWSLLHCRWILYQLSYQESPARSW